MGMTYIIGVNPKSDEQSAHLNLNSTSEMYLDSVFTLAIKSKLPDLYEKISEEVIFIRFDYLSQKDFMTVVNQIRQLKDRTDLLEGNKIGLEIWDELFEPLILKDERYDTK